MSIEDMIRSIVREEIALAIAPPKNSPPAPEAAPRPPSPPAAPIAAPAPVPASAQPLAAPTAAGVGYVVSESKMSKDGKYLMFKLLDAGAVAVWLRFYWSDKPELREQWQPCFAHFVQLCGVTSFADTEELHGATLKLAKRPDQLIVQDLAIMREVLGME